MVKAVVGYLPGVKPLPLLLSSLVFIAAGVLLIIGRAGLTWSVVSILLGIGGLLAVPIRRAQMRGDPSAGQPDSGGGLTAASGRYVLLAVVACALGAVIGAILLIVGPAGRGRLGGDLSPTHVRIIGAFVFAFCAAGVVAGLHRWKANRHQ